LGDQVGYFIESLGTARGDHQPSILESAGPANDPQGFENDLFLTAGGASGNNQMGIRRETERLNDIVRDQAIPQGLLRCRTDISADKDLRRR
jgi:hypothetical protein